MRSQRLTLTLVSALAIVAWPGAAPSNAAGRQEPAPLTAAAVGSARPETVLFDASFTHEGVSGPDAPHVGHQQLASGLLRDAAGRRVGTFSFTCTWIRILSGGDALERCAGVGRTADGRLQIAGPARESDATKMWRLKGLTGAYRAARGTALVRDIGPTEAVITLTIAPRAGIALHVAAIEHSAANEGFTAHVERICARASQTLATLPPFPFANFDPLHPDPRLLPRVGAFFTGRGDPRPILRRLDTRLRGLPLPPVDRGRWNRMLRARSAELVLINRQDTAALAANARAFVDTVHSSTGTFRQVAITAIVFGATRCVI